MQSVHLRTRGGPLAAKPEHPINGRRPSWGRTTRHDPVQGSPTLSMKLQTDIFSCRSLYAACEKPPKKEKKEEFARGQKNVKEKVSRTSK